MSATLRFTRKCWDSFLKNGGHDATIFPRATVVQAVPGRIEMKVPIEKHNLNRVGTLHGGAIASLVDSVGSLSLSTHGLYYTGVSVDMHQTFAKASGTVGDEVLAVGTVESLGRSLAYTRVELQHPTTRALLAWGSHTKFVGKVWRAKENVKFSEDGETVVEGSID